MITLDYDLSTTPTPDLTTISNTQNQLVNEDKITPHFDTDSVDISLSSHGQQFEKEKVNLKKNVYSPQAVVTLP